tara:strand:- start:547 stop:1179 length:633 start_codon:yes stop_codon:yes gene_type:complete
MNEYIDATSYESSSNAVITELHETIITLRARIITLEKKLEMQKTDLIRFSKVKKAFESGMKRINDYDDELLRLRQIIDYYEEQLELIWKRRVRPQAVLEGKKEAYEKYVPFQRSKNSTFIAQFIEMKKHYEEDGIKLRDLTNKYNQLKELNDNAGISEEMQKDIEDRFESLNKELQEAREDVEYYKQFADNDKITERLRATGRRIPLSAR